MSKSLKKNYIYNVVYQIIALIVPLITAPYIGRVLQAEGVGQYSFSFSIANYFVILASLGFGYYGQREIAKFQNDKSTQSRIFWEIFVARLFSSSLAIILNLILCFNGVYGDYTTLMLWWLFGISATTFDINYLFQGNEGFDKIVGRNLIVKILSVFLIFFLVKREGDVWLYILCVGGSNLLGNVSLWLYLPKIITKVRLKDIKFYKHIIPTLKLFIPTIATSIYTVMDKTLIGLLIQDTYISNEITIIDGVEVVKSVIKNVSDLENGYYEQAEKIVKMTIVVITSLGTIMIPRNSSLFQNKKQKELKNNIYFATKYTFFLGLPITFGLIAISPNIIPWFLGEGFEKCILLMQLLSPLVVIIGLSNVFGLQYLVPTQRDKLFAFGILSGTITNLVLNIILIKLFWSVGAVIASLCAECMVTFVMFMVIRKEISFKMIFKQLIKPFISSVVMFVFVFLTQYFLKSTWYFTFILIIEGMLVYFLCEFFIKDDFLLFLINNVLSKIKNKKTS